jgi:hypothetical protein
MNDPIITLILSERRIMNDDLSAQDEEERQRRMFTILRSSKRYKNLSINMKDFEHSTLLF